MPGHHQAPKERPHVGPSKGQGRPLTGIERHLVDGNRIKFNLTELGRQRAKHLELPTWADADSFYHFAGRHPEIPATKLIDRFRENERERVKRTMKKFHR